ncbi:BadF/BadG/BcrA/BcrD ATPase family protein [Parapedobacter sp. GCM10030251]|jgi:Predicted N-acetylglucosamine kinase|uniref:BadF/BadG/BcrA/BcrD ATPase family protein n=1 Tax=Parapedobacter sp. GCM10030251 TaxID=3273419 RepID=UPI00361B4143
MILVADSGSTKTDWGLISDNGSITYFSTSGYNPFFMDIDSIRDAISSELGGQLDLVKVQRIFFYGAGCQGNQVSNMEQALRQVFTRAVAIEVSVDLLAAAKALLGDRPGFAAILGTGTNTCLYDGRAITYHIDSLGFLLGDEGSGAAMGKRILTDFLRNQMDDAVRNAFNRKYGLDEAVLMERVYASTHPNRYCASYTRFLDEPEAAGNYRKQVVGEAFRVFFEKLVCLYPAYQSLTFNCVGSIGYHFSDLLKIEAENRGMEVGSILPTVIEKLTLYHHSVA